MSRSATWSIWKSEVHLKPLVGFFSFDVVTVYDRTYNKGCKKVKETITHRPSRKLKTAAILFKHYWPALQGPAEGKEPTLIPIKGENQQLVVSFRGTLRLTDLVIPAPHYLYLRGEAGGTPTPEEVQYLQKMKRLPAPNHRDLHTENETITPGSVDIKVIVRVRRVT